MTNSEQNVTSDQTAEEDQVLAPATPGAEALPLPDDEADKPTEQ
ncbi:MAG: hypothetical protein VYB90_09080 [Actinomycetota bacterium]|nr:hypothetical protein [Actinomycetota bacterium]